MSLVEAKCTNCGAKLEIDNTKEAAICPICGSAFVVEKAINNITNNVTNENHINATNVNIVQNAPISFMNGVYEGETMTGKPHGYGVCRYPDGSRYEGNWLAGVRYGEGTITYENGSTWKGDWKNDKPFNGSGTVFNYESCYYVGDYKNGKANGTGTFYYENGKKWSGTFNDDKEWIGEGYLEIKYLGKVYQTFEGRINDGKPDENGEWHCNGHFVIDGTSFDVTNDVLNYVLTSSSQTLYIPDGIKKIDKHVRGFSGIIEIICPRSLTDFYAENLDQFSELESFEAPGIIKVPAKMLCGLQNLTSVKLINAEVIGKNSFDECRNLIHVEIPNAKIIKAYAFAGCNELKKLDVSKVKTIEDYGFAGCDLSELFNAPSVETLGEYALSGTSLKSVFFPKLKEIGQHAFCECEFLSEFSSDSVTIIDNCAFLGCSNLLKVDCPNASLNIGNHYDGFFQFDGCDKLQEIKLADDVNTSKLQTKTKTSSGGCYVATCIYGSYDCSQVWTLRRFRDKTLASTWYGRAFIHIYYAVSPTLVKWFGKTYWFKNIWKPVLDSMVKNLQSSGVEDTPYEDKKW